MNASKRGQGNNPSVSSADTSPYTGEAMGDSAVSQGAKPKMGVVDARTAKDAVSLRNVLSDREVLYLDRVAQAAGIRINIVDAQYGEGAADGWYENGEIYLTENCEDPVAWVATHELTHHLERAAPEAYRQYQEYVKKILTDEGGLEEQIARIRQHYAERNVDLTEEGAMRELAANFTERLRLDEDLFRRVAGENRNLAQRLLDSLKEFIRKVRRKLSGKQLSDLERTRQAWERALKESRGKTVETAERRYLLTDGRAGGSAAQTSGRITRAKAVEAVYEVLDHGDKGHDNLVLLGDMPHYIRELTGIEGDLYIYRNHAYENMVSEERAIEEGRPGGKRAHYHDLGEETMVEAIMALEYPSIVISDQMKAGNPALSLILPVFGDNDAPIHAAVSFDEDTDINGSLAKRPHVAVTFYEHPYDQPAGSRYRGLVEIVQKAIDEGKVLSVDKKIRADQPVMTERTSLGNIARSSLEKNVAQFRKEVNAFKEKNRINYSLRGARDLEHQVADLQKQNARLQARNEELRSRLERGGAVKVDGDIKTVQGNLGHATAAFTLDVYGHVTDQMKQASAARMEGYIKDVLSL